MRIDEVVGLYELFSHEAVEPLRQEGDKWRGDWIDGDISYNISFEPAKDFPGAYEMYFAPVNKPSGFDFTTDMLDRGKTSIAIFSKVIAYTRSFLNQVKPSGLMFGAFEPKRKAMYMRILRYLGADIKQGGYSVVQPNNFTLGIIKQHSKLYFQYQAKRMKDKARDMQDTKRDFVDSTREVFSRRQ